MLESSDVFFVLVGAVMIRAIHGVSFFSQFIVTAAIVIFALWASMLIYGILKMTAEIRIYPHQEQIGADLSFCMIEANNEVPF